MTGPTAVATGLKELESSLKTLETKVQRQVVRKGLRAGAKQMLPAVKAAAPVGATRKLASSFQVVGGGRVKKGIIRVFLQVGKKWFVGNVFYAGFINFGWHVGKRTKQLKTHYDRLRKGKKSLGVTDNRPFVPGKHFVEQASEATAASSIAKIVETIKAELSKAIEESRKGN